MPAFAQRDHATLANLYSRSPAFTSIGSDADELIDDSETLLGILRVQLDEMPSYEYDVERVEAYELGEVAWGLIIVHLRLDNGKTVSMRLTAVFALEDGVWRCVHSHSSIPVPNEEALGVALTTTLTALLESLDAETLAPIEARVGTAALMFTDIEGSTSLAHELGDTEWARLLAEHDRTITEIAGRHGGTVVKTLGDGALVAFGGARPTLRCAGELQAAFAGKPFAVRIGVHAGDVVHAGDDVIGSTVNKAARVAAAAAGGQVIVSAVTRELAGESDEFDYGDPFLAELKGIPGVHELVPLLTGGEAVREGGAAAAEHR